MYQTLISIWAFVKRLATRSIWAAGLLAVSACVALYEPVDVADPDSSPLNRAIPAPTPLPPLELAVDRWQRLATAGGSGQTSFAVHPTDPAVVYVSSANGGLFKTENAGDTWVSVSSNLGAYRLGYVALDPLAPEVIYVTASTSYGPAAAGGKRGEIYRSQNGGRSWALLTDQMGFQNTHQAALVLPYDPDRPDRFDGNGDGQSDVLLVGAWTGPADPPVGGIWRSLDQGATFQQLAFAEHNITALRALPGNAEGLVATTYEGRIYRSLDLGETWAEITGNLDLAHLSDVAVDPTHPDTLYVTCLDCPSGQPPVWKTETAGATWQAITQGLPSRPSSDGIAGFTRILVDREDPNRLFLSAMGYADSLYESSDGGRRWQAMPGALVLPDGRPFFWYRIPNSLTVEQAIDGRLYADGAGVWRYPDSASLSEPAALGQARWEPATVGVGNVHVNAVAVDPTNGDVIYQGISDFGPFKSTDRGASFHRIVGNGWPVTVDNYVWNGPYYGNYQHCQLDCSSECNRREAIAAGGTTDFAISKQDPNVVYSTFGSGGNQSRHGGVNKSLDGGATWQPVGWQLEQGFELNPATCVPYGFRHLALDPNDDRRLFAVMELPDAAGNAITSQVYRTTDGGATWALVQRVDGTVTGIEVSAHDPQVVVLTTMSDVLRSTSGGAADSWASIRPEAAQGLRALALSPHRAGAYVVGTNNQGIWTTVDAGLTWTNNPLDGFFEQHVSATDPTRLDPEIATAHAPGLVPRRNISAIAFAPQSEDTFYVAGHQRPRASVGVARITLGGTHWERLPLAGLSHRNVYAMAIDTEEQYLYVGTNDGVFGLALR